jgi:uncharacterized protein (DUF2235 family)
MAKNIVLLSDGTGNSNIKNRGTNVFKLYEAIDLCGAAQDPRKQVAFYDDGVGTESLKLLKMFGGAFGWGLARNVRSLYKRLAQAYEPGDKIFLFGFSRGAFTVRTLAGLIAAKGIVDASAYPTDDKLDLAVLHLYESYRAKEPAVLEKALYQPVVQLLLETYSPGPIAIVPGTGTSSADFRIAFMGVWDTVDAVGLPFDEATDWWNKYVFRFKFADHYLNPCVNAACQALSVDEARQSFHPVMWHDSPRIEQVWFPGTHANVGGGRPQQGLSVLALEWMMDKARAAGLRFAPNDEEFARDRKSAYNKLYDSRSGVGAYYRFKPRDVAKLGTDHDIAAPKVHVSVLQRIAEGVFGYAPGNLPPHFEVVDNKGIHPNSAKVAEVIASGTAPSQPSLLQQTEQLIEQRRIVYYLMWAYSAFTVYWLVADDIRGHGFWGGLFSALKILVAPDSLLDKLVLLLWGNTWLVVVGLAIFGFSVYLRKRTEKVYSLYWSRFRALLKPLVC